MDIDINNICAAYWSASAPQPPSPGDSLILQFFCSSFLSSKRTTRSFTPDTTLSSMELGFINTPRIDRPPRPEIPWLGFLHLHLHLHQFARAQDGSRRAIVSTRSSMVKSRKWQRWRSRTKTRPRDSASVSVSVSTPAHTHRDGWRSPRTNESIRSPRKTSPTSLRQRAILEFLSKYQFQSQLQFNRGGKLQHRPGQFYRIHRTNWPIKSTIPRTLQHPTKSISNSSRIIRMQRRHRNKSRRIRNLLAIYR